MKTGPMSYKECNEIISEYDSFQKLLLKFTSKKYIVSFDAHGDLLQISVQPTTTGMGSSITINKDANWFDALKAIELKLL